MNAVPAATAMRTASHERLIDALVKLKFGALEWLSYVQIHTTLRGAKADAEIASRFVREAHEALLIVAREALSCGHRDGCCCIDCRNKLM